MIRLVFQRNSCGTRVEAPPDAGETQAGRRGGGAGPGEREGLQGRERGLVLTQGCTPGARPPATASSLSLRLAVPLPPGQFPAARNHSLSLQR